MLKIFIGYDSKEPVAYHVLAHSILRRASAPVAIIPLRRELLAGIYNRERGPLESTEFSMTRFLVPFLCDYQGQAIFMDCDMLCRTDIHRVLEETRQGPSEEEKAVWVCKHDYVPNPERKFLGLPQTIYPRKNWSSFVVFENALCRALTPGYVNEASGLDLHRFRWLPRDSQIGSLHIGWNWLVEEYESDLHRAKILHYTRGGPWFPGFERCDQANLWREEREHMLGLGLER